MVLCEAIIAYDATVNNASKALSALAPTSLTIRDAAYGKAVITHAAAFCSTDDVNHVYCVPSGYKDSNGFEIPNIYRYAATAQFNLSACKLSKEIPLEANSALVVTAQSETAANTVVFVWIWVEYRGQRGEFVDVGAGEGSTQRLINAGAALTSVVAKDGTNITSLQAGRRYQPAAISGVGVNGQTAGITGPCFVKLGGPAEFSGMQCFLPLANSTNYVATGGLNNEDFKEAGIKMPVFSAPNTLVPTFLGYTAEQPAGTLILNVDKVY